MELEGENRTSSDLWINQAIQWKRETGQNQRPFKHERCVKKRGKKGSTLELLFLIPWIIQESWNSHSNTRLCIQMTQTFSVCCVQLFGCYESDRQLSITFSWFKQFLFLVPVKLLIFHENPLGIAVIFSHASWDEGKGLWCLFLMWMATEALAAFSLRASHLHWLHLQAEP